MINYGHDKSRSVTECPAVSILFNVISTHTPLARRDRRDVDDVRNEKISTHTPLARRDIVRFNRALLYPISTHTPLARRDAARRDSRRLSFHFYSHASCEA